MERFQRQQVDDDRRNRNVLGGSCSNREGNRGTQHQRHAHIQGQQSKHCKNYEVKMCEENILTAELSEHRDRLIRCGPSALPFHSPADPASWLYFPLVIPVPVFQSNYLRLDFCGSFSRESTSYRHALRAHLDGWVGGEDRYDSG